MFENITFFNRQCGRQSVLWQEAWSFGIVLAEWREVKMDVIQCRTDEQTTITKQGETIEIRRE